MVLRKAFIAAILALGLAAAPSVAYAQAQADKTGTGAAAGQSAFEEATGMTFEQYAAIFGIAAALALLIALGIGDDDGRRAAVTTTTTPTTTTK